MGWLETCGLDERIRFVLALEAGDESFSLTCLRFGVSRKTGYKWLERYRSEGALGLLDRSRAPLSPHRPVSDEIAKACVSVRRAHPTWGPLKIKALLERREPGVGWPAASTIGRMLDAEGLTVKRRARRRGPPSTQPFAACTSPNAVWCMDMKGWFLTGDGTHCEPFTLIDADSRYLLRCQALNRNDTDHVWPVLDAAFREFGRPLRLRSDNGPPFASRGAGGLSRLSVRLIKAGITPERIEPGKPQQNGRLERLHLTLLQDAASPPERSLKAQIDRFNRFRAIYNEERPHQALGNKTPADIYAPSPRAWDGILREPDYPADQLVRRVRSDGMIKWRGQRIYTNEALAGEPVGLTEGETGWNVSYGPVLLGRIDPRRPRLLRPTKKARGLVDDPRGSPTTPPAQQPL